MQGMELPRTGALAVLVLVAAGVSTAQEGTESATPESGDRPEAVQEAPAEAAPVPQRGYSFLGDRDAILSSWLGSGLAERLTLTESVGGRELFAVQFGAPGPIPLGERTTMLLLGALDGISASGSQAVLHVTDALLAAPDLLPADVTFISIPWPNPDGLARLFASGCVDGRNDRELDDDRDGRFGEDQPDDLDGDGVVFEMLLEDPAGPWVVDEDGRFLRRARDGEAPRYIRTREGRDDDGDGLFNEDQSGGVALDRNFPVNWRGPWTGALSGMYPLSEPASRAIAELALSRRTALAFVFQGNHGKLATPGGVHSGEGVLELPFAADEPSYRQIVERFAAQTGRRQSSPASLATVHGAPRPGAAVDWFYAALGALSMEIGVWGPDVDQPDTGPMEGQFRPGGEDEGGTGSSGLPEELDADTARLVDRSWARWLDEARGGIGFVDWQPVDLEGGRLALIGGWQPYTCINPPAELLPVALHGLDEFVRGLVRGMPQLEVEVEEISREGLIGTLRVRLRNRGELPSGVGPDGGGYGARLALELPQGASLIAGEEVIELGHLPGQGQSRSFDWLVVAPEESVFRIVVDSRWSRAVVKEVTL